MPLFPPQAYRNTENTHRRGERADQPLATDVLAGTLYYVVDEGITEQSDGAAWTAWSGAGSRLSYVVNYSYSANTASPPGTNQARFNAGFPYTAVTKLYFDKVTADGQDVIIGLLRVSPGSLIYVQDKNDNTQYGTFLTTGFPINHTTWVEYDVTHYDHGSAIGGGQLVLVQSTWGPTTNPTFDPGSVPFGGGSGTLTEDNTNFFFDDSTDQLKVTGSVLSPLIIGGTGVTDDLSLQATSGVGTTGSWIFFKVGNNGAVTTMEMNHEGRVGIGTTGLIGLSATFNVRAIAIDDIGYVSIFQGITSSYVLVKTGSGANEQAGFVFEQSNNGVDWRCCIVGNSDNAFRFSHATTGVLWGTVNHNVIIDDGNSDPTAGSKCLIFGDGTVPSGLDSNTAGLYANDVSGTVNMFAINEAGGSSQLTGFTAGSVIFASSTGGFTEDATNLVWDDTNNILKAPLYAGVGGTLGVAVNSSGFITGSGQPSTYVGKTGTQTLTTGVTASVAFDTESYDVGSCHDNSTNNNRLTVPTGGAGTYLMTGTLTYDPNSAGLRMAAIRINGATAIAINIVNPVIGDVTSIQATALYQLAAADYAEMLALQTSGGNLNITTACSFTWVKVW